MTTTTRAGLLGGAIGGLSGGVMGLSITFLVRQPDLKWLGPFVAAFLASLLSAVITHHLYKRRTAEAKATPVKPV